MPILKPEIKNVSQKVNRVSIIFNLIKPRDNSFLTCQTCLSIGHTQVKIRCEVYFLSFGKVNLHGCKNKKPGRFLKLARLHGHSLISFWNCRSLFGFLRPLYSSCFRLFSLLLRSAISKFLICSLMRKRSLTDQTL